jgi:hypothetical protein
MTSQQGTPILPGHLSTTEMSSGYPTPRNERQAYHREWTYHFEQLKRHNVPLSTLQLNYEDQDIDINGEIIQHGTADEYRF